MSQSATASAAPAPAMILFGRDDTGKPHASWFGEADAGLAEKAADMMGMATLKVASGELQALAGRLPQGRVFASGRAFVPFVKAGLFDDLARHLPATSARISQPDQPPTPAKPRTAADEAASSPSIEGSHVASAKPEVATKQPYPLDWSSIAVGHVVLACEAGEQGWFEAHVEQAKSDGLFVLRWRDWPDFPPIVRRVEHIALMHPKHDGASA